MKPTLMAAPELASALAGVQAGFSTALPRMPDGELAPLVRDLFAAKWNGSGDKVPNPVLLRQVHSATLRRLAAPGVPDSTSVEPSDGAWTESSEGHLLAIKTADCVPILAVDPETGAYGAVHAGWRGAAAGIMRNLLQDWRERGSSLQNVRLQLGPHIQGCCYEVKTDCLSSFSQDELAEAVSEEGSRVTLHLAAVLQWQAQAAGVSSMQMTVSPHCTYCHRDNEGHAPYASYRRSMHEGRAHDTTNVALIRATPSSRHP